MIRIAIIGGGPDGLMTAYLVEQKYGDLCRVTVFEATGRIGGKTVPRTRLELDSPVVRVEKNRNESYRVLVCRGGDVVRRDFNAVFIALPHKCLNRIEWGGERLRRAMAEHIAYYDLRDTRTSHWPEPAEHPGIFIVGDYLFDSTTNGVFDSANLATDLLHSYLQLLMRPGRATDSTDVTDWYGFEEGRL